MNESDLIKSESELIKRDAEPESEQKEAPGSEAKT